MISLLLCRKNVTCHIQLGVFNVRDMHEHAHACRESDKRRDLAKLVLKAILENCLAYIKISLRDLKS